MTVTGPADASMGVFAVAFTFSEDVTGFTAANVTVTGGAPLPETFAGSGAVYTLDIAPLTGAAVTISVAAGVAVDQAGNASAASNVLELLARSPATEFAENAAEIRQVIRDDTRRKLQNDISFNQSLVRNARDRFRSSRTQMAARETGLVGRNTLPFDVSGNVSIVGRSANTQGSFFGQNGSDDGAWRQILIGDFDLRQDEDGSLSYSLNTDIAWEQMITDQTMLGYYIGTQIGGSDFAGSFEGTRSGYGVNMGAYAVSAQSANLIADGFVSVSISRNELSLSNGTIDLESEYDSTAAIAGASLSGIVPMGQAELQPELSVVYGKAFVGDIGFVGQAFGVTDNNLGLNAGNVTLANVMFRPQVRIPLGESGAQFAFSPRFECQWLDDLESCRSGADFGGDYRSNDGSTVVNLGLSVDDLSMGALSSIQLRFERRF